MNNEKDYNPLSYEDNIEMLEILADDELMELRNGVSYIEEWKKIKSKIAEINKKYANNEFFKEQAIINFRKRYIYKIADLNENSSEYEFYHIVLEYLGVDDYTLDYEIEKIKRTRKKQNF